MQRDAALCSGLALLLYVAACGSNAASPGSDGGPPVDGSPPQPADSEVDASRPDAPAPDAPDASLTPPAPCPSTGKGAVVAAGASCVVFTPEATGAAGVNARVPHYALAPRAGASGALVVSLNGSGGSPAGVADDRAKNVYTAAVAEGHHVIGLSYRSDVALGQLCSRSDGCYLPSRSTIVTGVYQPGAAEELRDAVPGEGIHARLALALRYLTLTDPQGGWGAFVQPSADPAEAVRWADVIVSGHSQGGGHAALLGKLHAVRRIVTLSSPCDQTADAPAGWLTHDLSWRTDPSQSAFGFSAETTFGPGGRPSGGDTTCSAHAAIWAAMGIDPSRRFDDAVVCAGATAHGATVGCPENFDRLRSLYRL